jgi:hypothetical protein
VCHLLKDLEISIIRLLDGISVQDLLERWQASRLDLVDDWVI